ncbi:glycosyltransferase family 2 protein [Faecalibacter rhinopitheci]|uniref:Glycosyltransferase family 2 protein n=1 Tax=Faecalibacter rhinopitheci TaxID=2779678 RepID=A0A8J7FRX0_9FLAO|nr:glycosyltransferase family 2 protein [Faecalibacter rhinopitheci]MBF0597493.1 glycosyltransferase family 2 protein [Faecalibacter rhinopitheci]
MTNEPLFSILVANYNNGHYFEDCYKSIINQNYQNYEVIIVDDCSTDNSIEIIKKLIKNDNRFKIYQNSTNNGAGYTKRKCIDFATGEICAFVDPDDAITSEALLVMVNAYIDNPNSSLIYSQYIRCDVDLNEESYFKSKQVVNNLNDFFNFEGNISHFSMFSKSFYLKTEGINPYLKRAVDQDLYIKLYEKGPVVFIDKYLYKYRIHSGGISTNENKSKAIFWHWVVILDAAKRRNINVEEIFVNQYVSRKDFNKINNKVELIKKSRLLKILHKIGLSPIYKYL